MRHSKWALAALIAVSMLASQALAQRTGPTGNGGVSDRAARPGSDKNFNPTDDRDPFNRGLKAYDAGDYQLAERMFREVLVQSPDDATVLVLTGMSLSERGNYKLARKEYDHALRIDRKNLDAHRELGVALAKLGDAKGADAEMKSLQGLQKTCGTSCADAAKLERAVATVQAAITAGAAPKAG